VPTNLPAMNHASICINSLGIRDGVKSARTRHCVREAVFVRGRSSIPEPAPHSAQCNATIAASLARCEHAAGSCGHSRFQGARRAGVARGPLPCCARCSAALRSVLFPLAHGGRSLASAVVADLWFVVRGHGSAARSLGSHVAVGPARQGQHAHGTCRKRAGLRSLWDPRAHLERYGTERGRGEHLSACNLQRCVDDFSL